MLSAILAYSRYIHATAIRVKTYSFTRSQFLTVPVLANSLPAHQAIR